MWNPYLITGVLSIALWITIREQAFATNTVLALGRDHRASWLGGGRNFLHAQEKAGTRRGLALYLAGKVPSLIDENGGMRSRLRACAWLSATIAEMRPAKMMLIPVT